MGNLYFGGVPTELEVKALREAFPAMEVGQEITTEEVEKIIDVKKGESRYYTVTVRWRKEVERKDGLVIGQTPEGFRVLDDADKTNLSTKKLISATRLARRSRHVAALVDVSKLTPEQRKEFDHVAKASAAIILAAKIKPQAELPEI